MKLHEITMNLKQSNDQISWQLNSNVTQLRNRLDDSNQIGNRNKIEMNQTAMNLHQLDLNVTQVDNALNASIQAINELTQTCARSTFLSGSWLT